MNIYNMSFETYRVIAMYRYNAGFTVNYATFSSIDDFLSDEYGLYPVPRYPGHADDSYFPYRVTDDKLLSLFLLRWT